MSDFKRTLNELLALIIEEQQRQLAILEQVKVICIDTNEQLSTIRSRLIEQASRQGTEIHTHEKAILDHEVRLHRVERQVEEEFGSALPDAK